MSRSVNLLLLLSALFSALTGVGTSVRQPQQVSAVVQRAAPAATIRYQAPLAIRPVQALPALAGVAVGAIVPIVALPQREPLYLTRRRE